MDDIEKERVKINFRKDVTKLKIEEKNISVPANTEENMIEFILEIE